MKIVVENCGKSFHRQWLYRGINYTFDVPGIGDSHSIALLGANGSGKSTLGLMLLGQVSPTEGSIYWLNDLNQKLNAAAIIRESILISPSLELPEELSLGEWYEFHDSLRGFTEGFSKKKLLELCNFTSSTLKKTLATFSSGMKQRVKLATGFFTQSSVLFLDEPLTNLDDKGIQLYEELIRNCTKSRLTIVASNRLDEYAFCKQKLKIVGGSLTEVIN